MKNIHSLKHWGLEDEFWEDFLVSAVLVFWEGNMAYKLAYKLIALSLSWKLVFSFIICANTTSLDVLNNPPKKERLQRSSCFQQFWDDI